MKKALVIAALLATMGAAQVEARGFTLHLNSNRVENDANRQQRNAQANTEQAIRAAKKRAALRALQQRSITCRTVVRGNVRKTVCRRGW